MNFLNIILILAGTLITYVCAIYVFFFHDTYDLKLENKYSIVC